jgi:hypothetical protein
MRSNQFGLGCAMCVWLFALIGCSPLPRFDHPTVSLDQADSYPELYGTYRAEDPITREVYTLHVGTAGKSYAPGVLKCILVHHPSVGSQEAMEHFTFGAFADRIGSHYVLHLPDPKAEENAKPQAPGEISNLKNIEGYHLLRVTCEKEGLQVAWQNEEFIENAIRTGAIPGILKTEPQLVASTAIRSGELVEPAVVEAPSARERHERTRVTASPSDLRDFVARTLTTGLFTSKNTFYRRLDALPSKD